MLLIWSCLFMLTLFSVQSQVLRDNSDLGFSKNDKCHLEDEDANLITDILLLKETGNYKFMIKCINWNDGFTIAPNLPESSEFDPIYGILEVSSSNPFPKTVYTITATNEHENSTVVFSIDFKECEYGTPVKIEVEGNILYTLDNEESGFHFASSRSRFLCIPYKAYKSTMKCLYKLDGMSNICHLSIGYDNEKTNQHYYIEREYIPGEEEHDVFNLNYNQQPPVLRTPPHATLTCLNYCNSYLLNVEGKVTKLVLEPASEEIDCELNGSEFKCKPRRGANTVVSHTVVLMNEFGNVSFPMTFAINQCPNQWNRFIFHRSTGGSYADTAYNLIVEGSKYVGKFNTASFCVPEANDIDIFMTAAAPERWNHEQPFEVTQAYKDYTYEPIAFYTLEEDRIQDTRHFHYKVLVNDNATYKYYNSTVSENWMNIDFNDKDWFEGQADQSGQWGKYASQPVYFRKTFDIDSLDNYSVITLSVETYGDCIGYLNGEEVINLHDLRNTVYRHKFISISLLKQHNILAFKYYNGDEGKPIIFNAFAYVTSSMCGHQPEKGKAKSPNDVKGSYLETIFNESPIKDPCILYGDYISISYTYNNGDAVVSNQVKINRISNNRNIKSFIIQGLIGNETVTLYKTTNPFMVNNDYKVVSFDNTRAFTTYKVIFYGDKQKDFTLELLKLDFMLCNRLYCSQQHDLPYAIEGTVQYKKCPFGQLGKRQVECYNNEHGAEWIEKANTCLKRIPSQSVSYVDWTFEIDYCNYDDWFSIQPSMTKLITTNLPVFDHEINYIFMDHSIINNMDKITIFVRFEVDSTISKYVAKHLTNLRPSFNTLVKKYIDTTYESSIISIKLRNPINFGLIIICIVVVLIIFVLSLLLYRSRLALKRSTSRKNLKKSVSINLREGNKENLLISSDY